MRASWSVLVSANLHAPLLTVSGVWMWPRVSVFTTVKTHLGGGRRGGGRGVVTLRFVTRVSLPILACHSDTQTLSCSPSSSSSLTEESHATSGWGAVLHQACDEIVSWSDEMELGCGVVHHQYTTVHQYCTPPVHHCTLRWVTAPNCIPMFKHCNTSGHNSGVLMNTKVIPFLDDNGM